MAIQQAPNQAGKVKGVADVVFCIDITGSMQPCIDSVKNHINAFLDSAKGAQSPLSSLRVRFVGYRDVEKDGTPFEGLDNPFTEDIAAMKAQVAPFKAMGGDDDPESTLDAIYRVVKESPWREKGACQRFVVVFTDAATKDLADATVSDPAEPRDAARVAALIAENRVKVVVYGPNGDAKYATVTSAPGSMFFGQDDIHAYLNGGADFAKLMEGLGKTVSKASMVAVASTSTL